MFCLCANHKKTEILVFGGNTLHEEEYYYKNHFKSQWIKPSSAALLIAETTNQRDSQQTKSNVGFY